MVLKDEGVIGKKFQHLTIIKKGPAYVSPNGKKSSQWWCQCDCGNPELVLIRYSNLTSGNTKSCGCWNDEVRRQKIKKVIETNKIDITGKRMGKLVAIKPTGGRKGSSVEWECQCDCGQIRYISTSEFNAGRQYSCGCMKESKGVFTIKNILNENNIPYITEKTFSDCRFPDTNQLARFDFYIDNRFLLEYDGEQHFRNVNPDYFKDNLEKRQEHDRIKNEYCKSHNIPLVRIPYTELNNLSLELIMGDKYLI